MERKINTTVGWKIENLFKTRKNKYICIWILDDEVDYSPYNEYFFLEELISSFFIDFLL